MAPRQPSDPSTLPTTARAGAVKIWRMPDLHDAEMLRGAYVRHTYPWHTHAEMCLGIVTDGAVRLQTNHAEGVARPGSFVLINSEEPHFGASASDRGWRCRTMHIKPDVIHAAALEYFGSKRDVVFTSPTFDDPALAIDLLKLHAGSEIGCAPLQRQCALLELLHKLLARHSRLEGRTAAAAPAAVARARAYLHDNMSRTITLDELSAEAGLPPFSLLRTFRRALGMTPHAYHVQVKVRAVCDMISSGHRLVDVAVNAGFSDQAHMTRVFRSVMGATPGQYRDAFGRANRNTN